MPTRKPPNPMCTGRVKIRDEAGEFERDEAGEIVTRPCANSAIDGGTVCRQHGAAAPQVAARAAVRAEVMRWGLGDTNVDPAEVLLRLVSQAAARAERYAVELEQFVEQHGGDLAAAMVGETLVLDKDGGTVKVGEYVRGLAQLEAAERDRCAAFAAKAVAAGLAMRQVELAERQGALIVQLLTAVFDELDLTEQQREAAPDVLDRHLRLVAG